MNFKDRLKRNRPLTTRAKLLNGKYLFYLSFFVFSVVIEIQFLYYTNSPFGNSSNAFGMPFSEVSRFLFLIFRTGNFVSSPIS